MKKIILILVMLSCFACVSKLRIPSHISKDLYFKTVMMNFDEFNDLFMVSDIKNIMVGDLMQGEVVLTSLSENSLYLQYKFHWYDKDDVEIDAHSQSWKPFVLYANERKSIKSVAINSGAKRFSISIK